MRRNKWRRKASRKFRTARYDGRALLEELKAPPDKRRAEKRRQRLEAIRAQRLSEIPADENPTNPPALDGEIIEPAEKPRFGRPQFEPTDEQRRVVEGAARFGLTLIQVAGFLGINVGTVRKHFAAELERGRFDANLAVAKNLHKQATKDDLRALPSIVWWEKTRTGLKETVAHEVTGADGKPIEHKVDLSALSDEDLSALIDLSEKLALAGPGGGGEPA